MRQDDDIVLSVRLDSTVFAVSVDRYQYDRWNYCWTIEDAIDHTLIGAGNDLGSGARSFDDGPEPLGKMLGSFLVFCSAAAEAYEYALRENRAYSELDGAVFDEDIAKTLHEIGSDQLALLADAVDPQE